MRKQQKKAWIAALGAVTLLAVGAGSAMAAEKGEAHMHGVQAHVDKAGKIRQPTPAEIKAVSDAFKKLVVGRSSAQGVQVVEHADGSVSAQLGAEALNIWVATINPDGSISQACVENGAAQVAAPALEEK